MAVLMRHARRAAALAAMCLAATACSLRDLDDLRQPGGAGGAGGGVGADLCPGPGWCQLPQTRLRDACPAKNALWDYPYYCHYVLDDANSAIADTERDRLILWGAGQGALGYPGNELYALDLRTRALSRLDDPTAAPADAGCPPALADGKPAGRVTFDALVHLPERDQMLAHGGERACADGSGELLHELASDTWLLDLASLAWSRVAAADASAPPAAIGAAADHDPQTDSVLMQTQNALWRLDLTTNVFTQVLEQGASFSVTARLDPVRRRLVVMGCKGCGAAPGLLVYDIDDQFAVEDWTDQMTGCDELLQAAAPGLAFDPDRELLVGWPGTGGAVYLLDLEAKACERLDLDGGPSGAAHEAGTRGRFRYLPGPKLFALARAADEDAWVLRLPPP
jgi:hypothetical protein